VRKAFLKFFRNQIEYFWAEEECASMFLFHTTCVTLMTPIAGEIEITVTRFKISAEKYCQKGDPNSRTLQNIFRGLKKRGLLIQKQRNNSNKCVS